MAGLLDNESIDFDCPECGASTRTTIGQARRNPTISCPRGHRIGVEASGLDREMRKVDRALGDLERTFRRLGR